jgi:hypothetical protein
MQVPGRPIITPAVTAAAAFALLAAVVSVAFVSSQGGLRLPVAATVGASRGGSADATQVFAAATPQASQATAATAATPPPAVASPSPPTPGSSPTPTAQPGATPTPSRPPIARSSGPPDPLLALAPCPGHPGCYEYLVHRGDSYTAVNDRFGLLLWITDALNPGVVDKQVIVVGQTLYLGRDPEARLDPCPGDAPCRLYTVRSGDTLSVIAGRFGLSVAAISSLNPAVDPSRIVTGEIIRLPLFEG